jgi:redox-sensitive bicupin YhaK (pirin superfamily)
MIKIKRSADRGYADHGWLKSYHSFSFANYYNPEEMGFSDLRVINDDVIAPSYGFGIHPHKNMEIFTYVLEGALKHEDTLGNQAIIKAGDVQLMSTGKGVQHSEINASENDRVHLLQIWVLPSENGTEPLYQQQHFTRDEKLNQLRLIISQDGSRNSMKILQDVSVFASILEEGEKTNYLAEGKRNVYVHVAKGELQVNNEVLHSGDAIILTSPKIINIKAMIETEFLLFDLN